MPNIAAVLKEEISRLARKESRSETDRLKKASSAHRTDIAELKRRIRDLEKQVGSLLKATQALHTQGARSVAGGAEPGRGAPTRYSAKGLISLRKRLGLSAADLGLLIGTSGQAIYNWEQGTARPRGASIARLAELKTIGKREVARRLEAARAA